MPVGPPRLGSGSGRATELVEPSEGGVEICFVEKLTAAE
jgi:hypothetical protein